jgi:6-pyruvoyltetrahydropterin/6-carboxytetrahydropterin synthase
VRLTRRVRFSATHRYHRPDWDEARNRATFGACAAPEPHGHDYTCTVSVGGPVDPQTGMVLHECVVARYHGTSLNDAPEFQPGRRIPTCEEVAGVIATQVQGALTAAGATATVHEVTVAEDETLSATWLAAG